MATTFRDEKLKDLMNYFSSVEKGQKTLIKASWLRRFDDKFIETSKAFAEMKKEQELRNIG